MSYKGKRWLITGAAGFIGSHICERLLLEGAKVTRHRTLGKFLDASNFMTGTNADADATAHWPVEIYYIDRKSTETRDVVTWELAAVFDLAGVRVPKRQCTRAEFPSIGTFR